MTFAEAFQARPYDVEGIAKLIGRDLAYVDQLVNARMETDYRATRGEPAQVTGRKRASR